MSDPTAGSVDSGYVAFEGSFETWEPGDRQDPVDLVGTTYDGEPLDLTEWRGDVVVVNFWYASCPPCRKEAPDLKAIEEDYRTPGLRMVGVNPRDGTGTARAFETSFEVPYPSLNDEGARGVAAFKGLVPLQAMPSTVVLDRQGRVAARILGQIDPVVLRGLIDDALAEAA